MLKCINSIRVLWIFKLHDIAHKAEINVVKTQNEAVGNNVHVSDNVGKSIFANKKGPELGEICFPLFPLHCFSLQCASYHSYICY